MRLWQVSLFYTVPVYIG